jgi:hypothetical protein
MLSRIDWSPCRKTIVNMSLRAERRNLVQGALAPSRLRRRSASRNDRLFI